MPCVMLWVISALFYICNENAHFDITNAACSPLLHVERWVDGDSGQICSQGLGGNAMKELATHCAKNRTTLKTLSTLKTPKKTCHTKDIDKIEDIENIGWTPELSVNCFLILKRRCFCADKKFALPKLIKTQNVADLNRVITRK